MIQQSTSNKRYRNRPLLLVGRTTLLLSLALLGSFANRYWKYTVAREYDNPFSRLSAELFWQQDIYWGIAGAALLVLSIMLLRRARKAPEGPDTSDILDLER